MYKSTSKIKFYTIKEYVDVTTGEVISKAKYEREYRKIKSIKHKIEYNEQHGQIYGTTRYTIECCIREQLEIKFT
jgi:hypothetical protein